MGRQVLIRGDPIVLLWMFITNLKVHTVQSTLQFSIHKMALLSTELDEYILQKLSRVVRSGYRTYEKL